MWVLGDASAGVLMRGEAWSGEGLGQRLERGAVAG